MSSSTWVRNALPSAVRLSGRIYTCRRLIDLSLSLSLIALYFAGTQGVRTRTPAFHVLITTYDMILYDQHVLNKFNWEFLAVRVGRKYE